MHKHNNKDTQFTKIIYFCMWGALPNFSQIGQKISNVRVEINLRLSVKCITYSVCMKLRPFRHLLWKKYRTEFHENPPN